MSDDTVEFNDKGLQQLLKAFSGNETPFIEVGILADKTARSGADSTNAEIGMKHEFGTSYLPERSFLRMPLKDHLAPRLEAAGITDPDVIKKVLKDGTLIPFMKQIAVVAQDTVLEAFKTGGFGQWAPSDMTNKTVHQTLVETTQLRDSITAVVEK